MPAVIRPPSPATRSLYAPRPFADYCPTDRPASVSHWHTISDGVDNDFGAARWNLLWLCSPDLDRALDLPRSYGPAWKTLETRLGLAALAPAWAELRHACLCEPSVFKVWLERNADHLLLSGADALMPIVMQRLNEAIERFGADSRVKPAASSRIDRIAGNVVFVRFAAAPVTSGASPRRPRA